jgi:regulator of extracellular matrix RemA (YlzA/DUF370 family)
MSRIYNIDTGQGKIRFSYKITVVIDESSPISRMVDTIRANSQINSWLSKYRGRWVFTYKVNDNILYFETLQMVDNFKETFEGKESKHYIIKSIRSKNSKKKKGDE